MAESKPSSASLKKGSFADQLSARLAPYMAEITKSNIEQATKKFDEMIKDLNGDPELLTEIYNFTSKGFERQTESMVVLSRIKQVTEETLGLLSGVTDNEEKPGAKSDSSNEEDSDTVKYLKEKQEEDEKKEAQEKQEEKQEETKEKEEKKQEEEKKEEKKKESNNIATDIVKAVWHTAWDPIKTAIDIFSKRKNMVHDAFMLLLLWLPTKFNSLQDAYQKITVQIQDTVKKWIDDAKDDILKKLPSAPLHGADKAISMLTDRKITSRKIDDLGDELMAMSSEDFNALYNKVVTEGYGKNEKNYERIVSALKSAKIARNTEERVWKSTPTGGDYEVRYKVPEGFSKLAESMGMSADELMEKIQSTNAYSEAMNKIQEWSYANRGQHQHAVLQDSTYQKFVTPVMNEAFAGALTEIGVSGPAVADATGWTVDSTTGTTSQGTDTIENLGTSITIEKVPFVQQLVISLKENI